MFGCTLGVVQRGLPVVGCGKAEDHASDKYKWTTAVCVAAEGTCVWRTLLHCAQRRDEAPQTMSVKCPLNPRRPPVNIADSLHSHIPSQLTMRMKRGIVRESCDFCHGRKIKCDRAARVEQGFTNCSHCDVRESPCIVDHGDDIRARHKKQNSAQVADAAPEIQQNFRAENLSSHGTFDISSDNVQFLDQVFNFHPSLDIWGNSLLSLDLQPDYAAVMQDQSLAEPVRRGSQPRKDLWSSCGLGEEEFINGISAYFTFAAPALPVLSAEAYWSDYDAGKCSDALVYAIACRGIPFVQVTCKWETQQQLARKFKDAFFSSRKERQDGSVRLDDAEALALMMGFNYDTDADSGHSYGDMESLFLSYDSLVLMTLRCQSQDAHATFNSEGLASATQRRTLLFWHVYGLDAFDSLDRKSTPRVPDRGSGNERDNLPSLEPGSYLDAILSLSMVARKITSVLCSSKTKSEGAAYSDIKSLYSQLDDWHRFSCPFFLQRNQGNNGHLGAPSLVHGFSGQPDQLVQLQRSVLWALEINCYMQIESCVEAFGLFSSDKPFQVEIASQEVQLMTLQVVNTGLQLAKFMNEEWKQDTIRSPANIIPNIARDICAGLCNWVCIRATHLRQKGAEMENLSPYRRIRKRDNETDIGATMQGYVDAAGEFRQATATATSHKSTEAVLRSIDERISTLEEAMAQYGESG